MQSTYWLKKVLKMISLYVYKLLCTLQHIVIHAMQLSGVNSPGTSPSYRAHTQTPQVRIDTAELHRVCDNMLQRAQRYIDVQGDHFQHLL